MAEKFTNQRCEDCQGGLEYNKTEKYWECPYCGKKYERALRFDKVQIDGLAGINDLVRSTLLKIITLDFEGAQRDLSECEKINHASVGTLIAHMAFALFRSLYNPKDRQQELTKVNNYMQRLRRDFAEVDDPEEILYDFIDSSDIYALLVVLYSSVGESTRLQMIYNLLDCNEVYNPNVSKFLLNALLKSGKVEEADTLLNNMSAENARFGVMAVLTNYPSTLKKAEHLERLLSMGKRDADYSAIFNSYFEKTADSSDVVLEVFLTASARNVNFDASVVIRSIFEHCDSVETAQRIFTALSAKRLDEASAMAVLDWAAFGTDNPEISQIAFTSLFESNSVFELDDEIVIKLLASEQSDELRAAKLGQMMRTFKMSAKNIDRVVAYYMLQSEDSGELRREMFADLLGYVTSVQLTVIEKYLLTVTTDGEMKADILDMALAKSKSVALCNALFSQYLKLAVDAPEVREAVIGKLLDYRLIPDADAFNTYLLNPRELHSEALLDRLVKAGCKAGPQVFDRYLTTLADPSKYNAKLALCATQGSFVLSAAAFAKYLLLVSEPHPAKYHNGERYFAACREDMRNLRYPINTLGVSGNLAQAYLLTSGDASDVMSELIKMLQKAKIKLDVPLEGLSDRKKVKIHKLVEANEAKLHAKVQQLVKELL